MLILGKTADDKGAQLEALIHTTLVGEGYQNVRDNFVSAGGNELDVIADRVSMILGTEHRTRVLCEAKAYAGTVNMPAWQRFLGKVLISRAEERSTIAVLIALNGVNGNVAGSYAQLRRDDPDLLLIDGSDLEERARATGELSVATAAFESASVYFGRAPSKVESAYYVGVFYWIAWWGAEEYSILSGRGEMLTAPQIDALQSAARESLSGTFIPTTEARAHIEQLHAVRIAAFDRLIRGEDVSTDENDVTAGLAQEPFCREDEGHLRLLSPADLDAEGVARFFNCMLEYPIRLAQLTFVADRLHEPYVQRLIDVLYEVQSGFSLDENDEATLRSIVPYFPSLWRWLASPIEFIATHREPAVPQNDDVAAVDRNYFWEAVIDFVRRNFSGAELRGLLYDYLNIAELEERREVIVKSKSAIVARLSSSSRTSIAVLDEAAFEGVATQHLIIVNVPSAPEPWEREHPEPILTLDRSPDTAEPDELEAD